MDNQFPAGLDPVSLRLNLFEETSVYLLSIVTNVNNILRDSGDTQFNVDVLMIAMWSKLDSYDGTLDIQTRIVLNTIACTMLQDIFNFVDACVSNGIPVFETVMKVKDISSSINHQLVTVPNAVAKHNKFSVSRTNLIVRNALEFFIEYKLLEEKRVSYSDLGVQSQGYVTIIRFTQDFLNYFIQFLKRG